MAWRNCFLKLVHRPVPNLETVRKMPGLKIMARSGLKGRNIVDLKKVLTGRLCGRTYKCKVYSKGSGLQVVEKLIVKRTGKVGKLGKEEKDIQ